MRITPKQVAKAVHALPFANSKKHDIMQIATKLVEKAYKKNPVFFCGKTAYRIIGGLLYLLSFKYCKEYESEYFIRSKRFVKPLGHLPQLVVAQKLIFLSPKKTFCEVTIRQGYRDWLKLLPELEEKYLWS